MPGKALDRRRIPAEARLSAWTAPDGWSCRRLDWAQPAGAPARGALLFAGGRGDFIEKYLEAQRHWFDRGWTVTAFDWRGQGGSRGAGESGQADSFDPLVADLAALIRDWAGATPGPHVAVGHSMGGHLLLRTLAERRPALDAAVLVAPMLMINSAPLPPLAAAWTASLMARLGWARHPAWANPRGARSAGSTRQTRLTGCRERYEDELWWWGKEPGYDLGAPSWGWLRAAYASCRRLTAAALARVSRPVLLVGSDTDRLVTAAAIRRAYARLPDAELMMFPSAGHELLREADPVRLAAFERIDAFLDARAPRR
ncbi:MAG: alpha/beta hydrolase [Alphaproteobacteria bacterium]|nr:alpha/beta hydrolase [Alphaproteobacteria bacterium]MBV9370510.1 alpha/beta hydrolase [Alphaproteobacteria bacterium]MBV9901411.1 alpha/beta hydrolase [Alphaproteobacteria bacterium]